MKKIILIDDRPTYRDPLKEQIQALLSQGNEAYNVIVWDAELLRGLYSKNVDESSEDERESNADEDVWSRVLASETDIALIVVDHDLSGFKDVRISESAIANACKQLGVAICTYHRRPKRQTESQKLKSSVNQARSFSIDIDISDEINAAKEILNVAKGFQKIKNDYEANFSSDKRGDGPAAILATLLGKPELEDFLARYANGPTYASDLINHTKIGEDTDVNTKYITDRLPFVLGCWLYNYILPFPGIILNSVAAASYIDLNIDNFIEHKDNFNTALYKGPFSETNNYWWRYDLDSILDNADCESGVEYLTKIGIEEVSPSVCLKTRTSPAGFYCLINKMAISLEVSRGSLSWVPSGADLCRIEKEVYNKLAPMMGL